MYAPLQPHRNPLGPTTRWLLIGGVGGGVLLLTGLLIRHVVNARRCPPRDLVNYWWVNQRNHPQMLSLDEIMALRSGDRAVAVVGAELREPPAGRKDVSKPAYAVPVTVVEEYEGNWSWEPDCYIPDPKGEPGTNLGGIIFAGGGKEKLHGFLFRPTVVPGQPIDWTDLEV